MRWRSATSTRTCAGRARTTFRWEDDPGYLPTPDARGVFVRDAQRPLARDLHLSRGRAEPVAAREGRPQPADRQEAPNVVPGPFDAESVMLYRFDALLLQDVTEPVRADRQRHRPVRRRQAGPAAAVPGPRTRPRRHHGPGEGHLRTVGRRGRIGVRVVAVRGAGARTGARQGRFLRTARGAPADSARVSRQPATCGTAGVPWTGCRRASSSRSTTRRGGSADFEVQVRVVEEDQRSRGRHVAASHWV